MTYLKKAIFSAIPALVLAVAGMAAPDRAQAGSEPFVGEIAATGVSGYCPRGWAAAEGQILAISSNDALFSLLGTTFGGDGRTTFGLPDLRGRVPIGFGSGQGLTPRSWGQRGGAETVNLIENQMASHSHDVNATNSDGDWPGPGDKILAAAPPDSTFGQETIYSDQPFNVQMSDQMIANTGASQAIGVIDPTQVIRYCIALFGVYPSRS